ncbi:MAG: hypothetical protein M3R22_05780 [Pseudomonadota bacterium]|nr:hypothetical protein [Pseudomonadota bacterium]
MLTLRNARLEPRLTPRQRLRENLRLAYGLSLWAIALLCLASLGNACDSTSDLSSCVAAFSPGLL